ncbi:MAG: hypothetical protein ABIP53_01830 [Candidatus Limnocylindrales bacterium]
MRVDSSHTAPWDRVADHGQKVGWQGRDLPPGQVKKQPAAPVAVEPAPSQPTPTTPEVTVPGTTTPEATAPEAPSSPQIDVLA